MEPRKKLMIDKDFLTLAIRGDREQRLNECDSGLQCGRWGCSLSILVANIWRLPHSFVVYIQRGERKRILSFTKVIKVIKIS